MWVSEILPGARADYDETVDWYLDQDPQAALRFIEAAKQTLQSVIRDPERFATIASGIHGATVARFPIQIVYRIRGNVVEVVAYWHSSRRPGFWNARLDT